jgi:hypothetical protein
MLLFRRVLAILLLILSLPAQATRLEFVEMYIGFREGNEWVRSVSLLGRIQNMDGYSSQRVYIKVRANVSDTPYSQG